MKHIYKAPDYSAGYLGNRQEMWCGKVYDRKDPLIKHATIVHLLGIGGLIANPEDEPVCPSCWLNILERMNSVAVKNDPDQVIRLKRRIK